MHLHRFVRTEVFKTPRAVGFKHDYIVLRVWNKFKVDAARFYLVKSFVVQVDDVNSACLALAVHVSLA